MKLSRAFDYYSDANRTALLAASGLLIIAIAISDWVAVPNLALGFLYIIPIAMASGLLSNWQILAAASVCTALRELLGPFPVGSETIPRAVTVMTAFLGTGFLIRALARNRQMVAKHLRDVEEQVQRRREAELQLQVLVDNSPLAILIADRAGKILLANDAAHRLLGVSERNMEGKLIDAFLPVLSSLSRAGVHAEREVFRTDVETRGRRENGEMFLAHIWLSTFRVSSDTRLAAIVADASEDLRDREESSLHHVLRHSRIVVGAVAHEIRNLCGAIGIVHANLMRVSDLKENEDFKALGHLLNGLRSVASAELQFVSEGKAVETHLEPVLDNLRIVVEPSFRESDAQIRWSVPSDLPAVWAEPQALMQVFLNLCQNSRRVLERSPTKALTIAGSMEAGRVVLRFQDTGPGIRDPSRLFQPFQQDAEATGLGLYVSRAIVRGFGGDLRCEPQAHGGACFAVELISAGQEGGPSK